MIGQARNESWTYASVVLLVATLSAAVSAQTAAVSPSANATQPAPPAATQPAEAAVPAGLTQIQALVLEVKGRAQHAPVGTEVTDTAAWQAVAVGDTYPAGTLVRTGLGSHVTLQFGREEPYTVVMVERLTLANLATLYRTETEKVGQVTVNYGAVRGGVSEGGLRSSFVVDSTVATLTRRGTWGFRLFVERGTGRYVASLADEGMIQILNDITRERQTLYPGQYVTQAMVRWVDQTQFDRLIPLQDRTGLTTDEIQAKAFQDTGLAVIQPAPTADAPGLARPGFDAFVSDQVRLITQQQLRDRLNELLAPRRPGVIDRPEGDFRGTFGQ